MNDLTASKTLPEQPSLWSSVFLRIWAAIFLTALATFFLLMTLSAKVFVDTGSAFAANTVVLTQWLPAVLALPLIKAAVARHSARGLLVFCEVGSAVVLLFVPALFSSVPWLIALLLVKGGFDALSKVSRTVALKSYFSGEALNSAASYYNTAALAGGGVGALFGALLLGQMALVGVLALCCCMHLAAAGLYMSLPIAAKPNANRTEKNGRATRLDASVRSAIVYFIAAVCLYQGYHNIARSVFPVNQLGMSEAGIALVQTLTNLAYIVGAFAAARLPVTNGRYTTTGPLLHGLALLSLAPLPFMSVQVPGLAMYALFAFAFEMAFCVHLRYIITAAPSERMAQIVADTNALAVGSMVAFSLLGSYIVDKTSLGFITVAVIVAAGAVLVLTSSMNLRIQSSSGDGRPKGE